MPSLKDLKNRIASVKATRKITSAMKMVAAAKLRRAQEAAQAARPFSEKLNDVLGNLAQAAKDSPTAPKLLVGTGEEKTQLLVVATAERGLCGAFNSSIVKLARDDIRRHLSLGRTVKILTIGKKGREQLRREYGELMVDHVDLTGVRKVAYTDARPIGEDLLQRYAAGEFDVATLYFSKFKSVLSQTPTALRLVPALPESDGSEGEGAGAPTQYIYEPDEEQILADLLPKYITTQIFGALLENAASEQGARMAAMDNATRNAGEMIKKLTLEYNRSRQAAITKELIEIISGAEAL